MKIFRLRRHIHSKTILQEKYREKNHTETAVSQVKLDFFKPISNRFGNLQTDKLTQTDKREILNRFHPMESEK